MKSIKILLIEDNLSDAALIRRMLSKVRAPELSLQHAQHLAEGLAYLGEQDFDVVLLDLGLPDSRGIDTALTVRKQSERIPIIVITGFEDEEWALKALQRDIQDYLVKGQINSSLLLHSIRYSIERKHIAEELQNRETLFRAFFESAGVGAVQVDPVTSRFLQVNERFCRITGFDTEELLRMSYGDVTHSDAQDPSRDHIAKLISGELMDYSAEQRYVRKDGKPVWVQVSETVVRDATGKPIRIAGVVQDINKRKKAEEALRFSEWRFKVTTEAAGIGVWDMNLQDLTSWRSLEHEHIFGYQNLLPKWSYDTFIEHVLPEDREEVERKFNEALSQSRDWDVECRIRRADGDIRWIWARGRRHADVQGGPDRMLGLIQDITRQKQLEEDIKHLANHDVLTGLPNRRLFRNIIDVKVALARRYKQKLAILYLDLDHFKEINDTYGHEAGDELLREAAQRLISTIRGSDTVARIGGDEFNVLLADFDRIEDISDVVRKISDSFRLPFTIGSHEMIVTATIGVAIYPDDDDETDNLLRYADMAMYQAKELGRNTYQFYDPALNIRSEERTKLVNRLRQSLERGELMVYYQPQVNIDTGKMVSAEALIRWRHPELGILEPKDFIDTAKETGFIADIDKWVINTVCAQAKAWRDSGLPQLSVAVNVSAKGFQNPEFINGIISLLSETGLSPENLSIEIPESMAIGNIDRALAGAKELAKIGVRLSIDNFGTGHSSLIDLKRIPVAKLKIDKSFIQNITTDSDDRTIISAVTSMARSMGIKTVAGGVETEDQLAFLRENGCEEMQGYIVSKPLPVNSFEKLIAVGNVSHAT